MTMTTTNESTTKRTSACKCDFCGKSMIRAEETTYQGYPVHSKCRVKIIAMACEEIDERMVSYAKLTSYTVNETNFLIFFRSQWKRSVKSLNPMVR